MVLESQTIGWGASSRNGGMVLTGLKLGVNKLISMYGRELTRRMYTASLETVATVERIVQEEQIVCDFARTGHLEVACKQAHFDDYSRQVEVIAREFDHRLRVVPRGELGGEIGSGIYYGGMVDEISTGLNPARYVAGLAVATMEAGAQIHERTSLQSAQRETRNGAAGFRVQTSQGTFWTHNLLVGTSGYTGRATPALQKRSSRSGRSLLQRKSSPKSWRANSARATAKSTTRKTIFITIASHRTTACCLAGARPFFQKPIEPFARARNFCAAA